MKRRRFLKSAIIAGLAPAAASRGFAADKPLQLTPRDYEGPYYPVGERHRTADLVIGQPRDRILRFRGQVVNADGSPIAHGLVDMWQADPLGRYKHPRDRSAGERWSEFLYWAETPTDRDGRFEFRTYLPAAYNRRPAHIHYKVWHERRHLLTSQMYFEQTGGTRGASRSSANTSLQTVSINTEMEEYSCFLRVVV